MPNAFRWFAVAACAASLSGCLIPEKFDASIRVQPDGGYTYRYEGSAVHFLAAASIAKNGSLAAKDEADLKRDADKASKDPSVKKISYLGNGRYDITYEKALKAGGGQFDTLRIFNMSQDKEGTYSLGMPPIKAQDRTQLQALGIKIDGKMDVFLPDNAKVLSHNATGTPGLFSKAYSWKIGALDSQPSIRFTLAR